MLQGEHSAILSTFIKLTFVIKIFVLSIFEWLFYTQKSFQYKNICKTYKLNNSYKQTSWQNCNVCRSHINVPKHIYDASCTYVPKSKPSFYKVIQVLVNSSRSPNILMSMYNMYVAICKGPLVWKGFLFKTYSSSSRMRCTIQCLGPHTPLYTIKSPFFCLTLYIPVNNFSVVSGRVFLGFEPVLSKD